MSRPPIGQEEGNSRWLKPAGRGPCRAAAWRPKGFCSSRPPGSNGTACDLWKEAGEGLDVGLVSSNLGDSLTAEANTSRRPLLSVSLEDFHAREGEVLPLIPADEKPMATCEARGNASLLKVQGAAQATSPPTVMEEMASSPTPVLLQPDVAPIFGENSSDT